MANSIFFEYFRIAPDILEKVEIYKKKFDSIEDATGYRVELKKNTAKKR